MENWKVTGYLHSGITVKNMEESLKFYTETLGLKLVKRQTNTAPYVHDLVRIPGLKQIELAFVETSDAVLIELLEYSGMDSYSGESRSCDYGTGHICLKVINLDKMFSDLIEVGVQFKSEEVVTITAGNHKGSKSVYMKDPDGYLIELMEM